MPRIEPKVRSEIHTGPHVHLTPQDLERVLVALTHHPDEHAREICRRIKISQDSDPRFRTPTT